MSNQTAPTATDTIVINWAGLPLADWVINTKERSTNLWASEDQKWAYFQRFTCVSGTQTGYEDMTPHDKARLFVSYDEAGRTLAKS